MRITLATWPGLGDTIVSLPIAFYLEAQGHEVSILNTVGYGQVWHTQYAATLPTYPKLYATNWGRIIEPHGRQRSPIDDGLLPGDVPVGYGRVFDLTQTPNFDWHHQTSLCKDIAANARVVFEDAPDFPLLAIPAGYKRRAEELTGGPKPYVLVAPEGSRDERMLTPEQIAAVAGMTRAVIIHDKPREYAVDALNLTGQTSLEDVYALCACAACVVSVDTGVWHLAPAFLTPTIGVVGATSNPHSLASDYRPTLYLWGKHTEADVPVDLLRQAIKHVFLQRLTNPIPRSASGVRWWETSEVCSRLAQADAHQQRLSRAFGGSNIVQCWR